MSDWLVVADNGKEKECASRSEAELIKEDMEDLGLDCEIQPPTESDGGTRADEINESSNVEADVVDVSDTENAQTASDAIQDDSEGETTTPRGKLPDKPRVDEDPLTWMPSEFTDKIEGAVAINRKGYEVMAHHYGIGTSSTVEVGPEENGFEYSRVHATATTSEGVEYGAQGSAHTERGDDPELLVEMADTRARKRAVAQATGVGMVAVEELQNKP